MCTYSILTFVPLLWTGIPTSCDKNMCRFVCSVSAGFSLITRNLPQINSPERPCLPSARSVQIAPERRRSELLAKPAQVRAEQRTKDKVCLFRGVQIFLTLNLYLLTPFVALLWTGVPTSCDKNICRFFGAPAMPVFLDDWHNQSQINTLRAAKAEVWNRARGEA